MGMEIWVAAAAVLAVSVFAGTRGERAAAPVVEVSADARLVSEGIALAKAVSLVPWNGKSDVEWKQTADALRPAADRLSEREPSAEGLQVLLQTGRCAENSNDPTPEYYGKVDGTTWNLYYHRAVRMVRARPALLDTVADEEHRSMLKFYLDKGLAEQPAP